MTTPLAIATNVDDDNTNFKISSHVKNSVPLVKSEDDDSSIIAMVKDIDHLRIVLGNLEQNESLALNCISRARNYCRIQTVHRWLHDNGWYLLSQGHPNREKHVYRLCTLQEENYFTWYIVLILMVSSKLLPECLSLLHHIITPMATRKRVTG